LVECPEVDTNPPSPLALVWYNGQSYKYFLLTLVPLVLVPSSVGVNFRIGIGVSNCPNIDSARQPFLESQDAPCKKKPLTWTPSPLLWVL